MLEFITHSLYRNSLAIVLSILFQKQSLIIVLYFHKLLWLSEFLADICNCQVIYIWFVLITVCRLLILLYYLLASFWFGYLKINLETTAYSFKVKFNGFPWNNFRRLRLLHCTPMPRARVVLCWWHEQASQPNSINILVYFIGMQKCEIFLFSFFGFPLEWIQL